MIRVALDIRFDKAGTCVSWLPQYHDMGLIGSVITTFYTNYTGIYMSPLTFIKKPLLLLELCSEYRCTHLQTPHFIFPLLTRRWYNLEKEERLDLDLSSLHHIFNAAQPINPDEYTEFYQTFKSTGLRKSAITTGYGLAESVVYVSDSGHNSVRGGQVISVDKDLLKDNKIKIVSPNNPNSKKIIGCGYPPDNFQVDIYINPLKEKEKKGSQKKEKETDLKEEKNFFKQLYENWLKPHNDFLDFDNQLEDLIEVGEICVSSPSVCSYLYSKETQEQRLELNDKSYLKTGDLGFIYNNELFYCGRIKDMINLNGENIYPQDIEWSIQQNPNVRKGSVSTFDLNSKLYALVEFKNYDKETLQKDIQEIKNQVNLDHCLTLHQLIVLKPRSLPKTTSGKLSRLKAKQMYMDKQLIEFIN
jgi:acyl-CoA synthetase (AMP-forming)/AMP-acid ligase II